MTRSFSLCNILFARFSVLCITENSGCKKETKSSPSKFKKKISNIWYPRHQRDWNQEIRAIKSQGSLSPTVVSASHSVSLLLFSFHADQPLQLSAGWKVALYSLQVFKSSHFRRLSQSEARISPSQFRLLGKGPWPAQTRFSLVLISCGLEKWDHMVPIILAL